MSGVVDTARAILAAAQPTTGDRASGTVAVTTTGSEVVLPRNSVLLPVLNGQIRNELIFKTDKGTHLQNGCPKYSWLIPAGGASVSVISNVGGARHNLPAGTVLRWDPPITGLSPTATVEAPGFAGGADPTFFGGLKSAVVYEQFGGPSPSLEIFRSRMNLLPGMMVVWDGSEPADGAATNQLERGSSRAGRDSLLFREKFLILVIVNRKDSDDKRRDEGLEALDSLTEWLTDRQSVDGLVFSTPTGAQIRERFRLSGDSLVYQEHYIYGMRLSVVRAYTRRDARSYNDWLSTRIDWLTGTDNAPTDLEKKPIVRNQIVQMIQGGFSDGFSDGFG